MPEVNPVFSARSTLNSPEAEEAATEALNAGATFLQSAGDAGKAIKPLTPVLTGRMGTRLAAFNADTAVSKPGPGQQ